MLLGKVAEKSAESSSSEANHAKPKYQRPPHVTSSRNGTGIPLFLHGRSEKTSETSKEHPVEAWDVLFFQLCYIASIYDHVYFLDIYIYTSIYLKYVYIITFLTLIYFRSCGSDVYNGIVPFLRVCGLKQLPKDPAIARPEWSPCLSSSSQGASFWYSRSVGILPWDAMGAYWGLGLAHIPPLCCHYVVLPLWLFSEIVIIINRF